MMLKVSRWVQVAGNLALAASAFYAIGVNDALHNRAAMAANAGELLVLIQWFVLRVTTWSVRR